MPSVLRRRRGWLLAAAVVLCAAFGALTWLRNPVWSRRVLGTCPAPVWCLRFSNDGQRLAALDAVGIQVWDLATPRPPRHFATVTAAANAGFVFAPDGQRLALLDDRGVSIVDLRGPGQPVTLPASHDGLTGVGFSRDGQSWFSERGFLEAGVRWDAPFHRAPTPCPSVRQLTWARRSADGQRWSRLDPQAVAGMPPPDGLMEARALAARTPIANILSGLTPAGSPSALEWMRADDPSRAQIYPIGDGSRYLWRPPDDRPTALGTVAVDDPFYCCRTADNQILASAVGTVTAIAPGDGLVLYRQLREGLVGVDYALLNLETGAGAYLPEGSQGWTFMPDGRFLFGSQVDLDGRPVWFRYLPGIIQRSAWLDRHVRDPNVLTSKILVFDCATVSSIAEIPAAGLHCLALAPDGRTLAVGDSSGNVTLYEVPDRCRPRSASAAQAGRR